MTLSRTDVRRLLDSRGLRPSRALGQNFVVDRNTLQRIVRLAGIEPGQRVLEVGAGLGSLTLALAEAGATVLALEVDRHLLPLLESVVAEGAPPGAVEVRLADAMTVDWLGLLGSGPGPGDGPARGGGAGAGPWSMVSNLPYNVAVPVVLRLLEEAPTVRSLLVMVQREVGERLAAGVGDPAYGAVSVRVAWWASAATVGRVPPDVFVPRPRVESVLVRLTRHEEPGAGLSVHPEYRRLVTLVRAGFGQRRKTLRRSLAAVLVPEAFAAAGVDPGARAEELSLAQWADLAAQPGATHPSATHPAAEHPAVEPPPPEAPPPGGGAG